WQAPEPTPPQPAAAPRPTTGNVIPLNNPNGSSDTVLTPDAVIPPGDWGQTIARVSTFIPEKDHDLIEFMRREAAGMLGYGTAMMALFENCVGSKGLDPVAMRGLAEYSSAASEAASAMVMAHRAFMNVYQEIMRAVDGGVVMPFDGRFFGGGKAS
ncbi:MAG TPA: hypothetical protein VKA30_11070, partial [Actinomycetota bacterium]|nr:hypothetical protein [Actinomycetota bacterium]